MKWKKMFFTAAFLLITACGGTSDENEEESSQIEQPIDESQSTPQATAQSTSFITGTISHPLEWEFGGYLEVQNSRRKCKLFAYDQLAKATGFDDYDSFKNSHKDG